MKSNRSRKGKAILIIAVVMISMLALSLFSGCSGGSIGSSDSNVPSTSPTGTLPDASPTSSPTSGTSLDLAQGKQVSFDSFDFMNFDLFQKFDNFSHDGDFLGGILRGILIGGSGNDDTLSKGTFDINQTIVNPNGGQALITGTVTTDPTTGDKQASLQIVFTQWHVIRPFENEDEEEDESSPEESPTASPTPTDTPTPDPTGSPVVVDFYINGTKTVNFTLNGATSEFTATIAFQDLVFSSSESTVSYNGSITETGVVADDDVINTQFVVQVTKTKTDLATLETGSAAWDVTMDFAKLDETETFSLNGTVTFANFNGLDGIASIVTITPLTRVDDVFTAGDIEVTYGTSLLIMQITADNTLTITLDGTVIFTGTLGEFEDGEEEEEEY